jgi:hypothetical protein
MSWYRTGRVAVTNGSKTVTGVGTLFTTAVNAGDAFALVDANLNPTGAWYEVESVTNNTTLVLKQSYAGSTGSNKQYCVFNLVGNMTTPSFAQRLATFFASFQALLDKPTSTPTALGIPVADENGDIDSGWIPATFFNKTNILGTVSQFGGVPTGAVIESGTNANGYYVKFADGTMICRNKPGYIEDRSSAGLLTTNVTFAATFVVNAGISVITTVGTSAPVIVSGPSAILVTTTGCEIKIERPDMNSTLIYYAAIGRWF